MGKVKATNESEDKILRENHMELGRFGVLERAEGKIVLLCYPSGCKITIEEGLRKWS